MIMAETFSLEYTQLYIQKPAAKTQRQHVWLRAQPWSYTQVLVGTAADTCVVAQLPPYSMLDLVGSWMKGSGFTAAMTLSVGWKAYTDQFGVVQAANANGLYNALDVSNTAFVVTGGMNSNATPDDSLTEMAALGYKDFQNASPVDLILTFGAQAPGVGATVHGIFKFMNIA
jgi:hypothetical protein